MDTPYFVNETGRFPDSCNCTSPNDTLCIQVNDIDQLIYNRSCSNTLSGFIEENLIAIGAVGFVFGLIEVS